MEDKIISSPNENGVSEFGQNPIENKGAKHTAKCQKCGGDIGKNTKCQCRPYLCYKCCGCCFDCETCSCSHKKK